MESIQKGFRRMPRVASRKLHAQQISLPDSMDLSRVMVVMNQHACQTKASIKAHYTAIRLLGTLVDELA